MPENKSQNLLIIATVWPEPKSSAAGQRMMQLISLFQDNGWEITVASASKKNKFSANLESLGITTADIEINRSDFDAFVKNLRPDAVIFDRFIIEEQFGWRVAKNCPETLRILDTEDLHCLRKGRRRAVEKGRTFKPEDLLQTDISKREIASVFRCDLSLIISEYEMELLKELFEVDDNLLHYLPFLLHQIDSHVVKNWLPFEQRKHFVMIGNFRHPPNMDAILYLKRDVWPILRQKIPDAQIHIYGAYPSSKTALHQPENGFYIEGRAEDAKVVNGQARVCLAPLRFGAGLKGKLVEAMQCGTPSITTDIGAEGLKSNLDWSGTIANTPEEFASAAANLYSNEKEWLEAQKNGAAIINQRFSKKLHSKSFIQKVFNIQNHLEEYRRKNFIGAMLMHHSMASTKYMAKWIEEKNKGG